MEMMLIGSAAYHYWKGSTREELHEMELDIIGDLDVRGSNPALRIDLSPTSSLNNGAFVDRYNTRDAITIGGVKVGVCSMLGLSILKRSHAHRIHKHQRNMHQLFKELDWANVRNQLRSVDRDLLLERQKMTPVEIKSPSLEKSNSDFFDDEVTKHFDHDWIHEQMAYYDKPLYTRLKRHPELARCEKDLWYDLLFRDKVRCVLEEAYVIALERWIVPATLAGERVMPHKNAVLNALRKVCTTLCSGWFRDFAIDYYPEIVSDIDTSKMAQFTEKHLCTSSLSR